MKEKKTLLLIALFQLFSTIMLQSQIKYELLIEKEKSCSPVTLTMTENDNIVIGISYQDTSELVKVNPQGEIVGSHFFYPQGDTAYYLHYTTKAAMSDKYIGIGEQNIGHTMDGVHKIWIFMFDEELNIQWERIIDVFPFAPLSMSCLYANNAYYFTISASPHDALTAIYKMDAQCEQIVQYLEIDHRPYPEYLGFGTTCFFRQIPGSSDFLTNYMDNDRYLYIIDEDLNIISDIRYSGIAFNYPIDAEFISETEFITAGICIESDENRQKSLFGLKKMDVTGNVNINQLEVFGYEWLDMYNPYIGCRTGERKTLAMHDNYFYYGGLGKDDFFTYWGYEDNLLLLYAFNHNLDSLWSMTVADDAYYMLWSIVPTDDGGCVMAAWRSDWRQGKNKWDTYIVKIAKPEFNNIATLPKNEIVVYPNPGGDRLSLRTEMERFTFQLFDMQGRLLLERQNEKEISTNELSSGLYLYKIIDRQGEMSTGKWVKQ